MSEDASRFKLRFKRMNLYWPEGWTVSQVEQDEFLANGRFSVLQTAGYLMPSAKGFWWIIKVLLYKHHSVIAIFS